MRVFVDTSAIMALLAINDPNHFEAARMLENLREQHAILVSTNYIIIEAIALLQRRLGMEAVRDLLTKILPLVQIEWVDVHTHESSIQALIIANWRMLSVVDCTSFATMRLLGITTAFVFDEHFEQQGFTCIP